jgi:hypothetical protein
VQFAALRMSPIGTKRTYRAVCYSSALGGKADISQRYSSNHHQDGGHVLPGVACGAIPCLGCAVLGRWSGVAGAGIQLE